jgi:N-acyl homoserine lactone hydrolase
VREAQRARKPGGLIRVLTDTRWTPWLPIYAWVIDHPEGIIVVDTGETARTAERGYFPSWHPYYRRAVQMDVKPEDEIGPQLAALGVARSDVRRVVLTHFHTDHAGGLAHFPDTEILVSAPDWKAARGVAGRLRGYLPNRWPRWFAPTSIPFARRALGPFERSYPLTAAGDVAIVPTPGHTPAHVSVIVQAEDVSYFLAGDTSYSEALLRERRPDGVSPSVGVTRATMDRILRYGTERPTVYLPTHDAEAVRRLEHKDVLSRTPSIGEATRGTRVP